MSDQATPCRYLIIGNPQPRRDVALPEAGRAGARLTGAGYRKARKVEYWENAAT